MLCLIPIVGGLLAMMGQHDRSEALFYYFRLEDQVPETFQHPQAIARVLTNGQLVLSRFINNYEAVPRLPSVHSLRKLNVPIVSR
jgi:hypothetical protein